MSDAWSQSARRRAAREGRSGKRSTCPASMERCARGHTGSSSPIGTREVNDGTITRYEVRGEAFR